jgi:hypothetical protein
VTGRRSTFAIGIEEKVKKKEKKISNSTTTPHDSSWLIM